MSILCLLHEGENCCTRRDEEGVLEGVCYCKLLIHRVLREACCVLVCVLELPCILTLSRYHVFDFQYRRGGEKMVKE